MTKRPEVPQDEFDAPLGGSGSKEPLDLLPDRTWLRAKIKEVKLQYAIFNGKIQNITRMDGTEVLDANDKPIPRKEFEIVFEFADYKLPNKEPRKAWLRMSASMGENAHLPVFLANVCPDDLFTKPKDVIASLKGLQVELQLSNKKSKKDPSRTYQNVIFDAVRFAGSKQERIEDPSPMTAKDIQYGDEEIPGTEPITPDDEEIPF